LHAFHIKGRFLPCDKVQFCTGYT